ncbi:MAG: hypothetical protein K6C06_01500 [Lachnospiraceae bacterium]|nr:hypothetical protein [Lachnospiraceae bacterium]
MFIKGFFGWILSLVLAFNVGAGVGANVDPELKQKVSDHIDVIVDESAGIVDDVAEAARAKADELRDSDAAKSAEEFVNDVDEIVNNTLDDIDSHFGKDETASAEETEAVTEGNAEEAVEETTEGA